MRKLLFIVNKKAGTDAKAKFPEQVNNILDKRQFDYDIAYTRFPGHAVELAAAAAEDGVDIIAAVGGDGSANEAARGILGSEAALALIPAGSGNGLARCLKIPRDIPGAIAVINELHPKWIDAGLANGHLFLSNAGVGFDALIAKLFEHNTGRGLFNYARLVLNAMRRYESKHYHLVTDSGEMHVQAFFVTAANGDQFGYGFKIAPGARLDDALLDICIMKPLNWRTLPAVSLRSLSGKPAESRFAKHIRCASLVLTQEGEKLEWMQVDGDALPVEGGQVQIRVQAKAIKVLVPDGV